MKHSKIFTKNITITDPTLLFTGNIDATVLEIFNNNWKGKCMNGVYVVSGDKILRRSKCILDNRSLKAYCTVSVEIEATIISYEQGDVVIGTVVTIDQSGDIILTSDIASIQIGNNNILKSVQVGDKMPVYVVKSQYTLGRPKVSIIGVPWVPIVSTMSFNIEPDDEKDDTLYDVVNQLEDQLKILSKSKPKVYTYMIKLLAVNKKGKPLSDLKKAVGPVMRPRFVGNNYMDTTSNAVTISRSVAIEQLVGAYIKELITTIELIDNYSEEEIKKYAHIFKLYK